MRVEPSLKAALQRGAQAQGTNFSSYVEKVIRAGLYAQDPVGIDVEEWLEAAIRKEVRRLLFAGYGSAFKEQGRTLTAVKPKKREE
jgi:hypothetical protein